ncbi:MAG: hypothetical protein K1Y36_02420 [Blastocatellia bacterium]|nr:hypothetical protein [Blastocatellia bacterium]
MKTWLRRSADLIWFRLCHILHVSLSGRTCNGVVAVPTAKAHIFNQTKTL